MGRQGSVEGSQDRQQPLRAVQLPTADRTQAHERREPQVLAVPLGGAGLIPRRTGAGVVGVDLVCQRLGGPHVVGRGSPLEDGQRVGYVGDPLGPPVVQQVQDLPVGVHRELHPPLDLGPVLRDLGLNAVVHARPPRPGEGHGPFAPVRDDEVHVLVDRPPVAAGQHRGEPRRVERRAQDPGRGPDGLEVPGALTRGRLAAALAEQRPNGHEGGRPEGDGLVEDPPVMRVGHPDPDDGQPALAGVLLTRRAGTKGKGLFGVGHDLGSYRRQGACDTGEADPLHAVIPVAKRAPNWRPGLVSDVAYLAGPALPRPRPCQQVTPARRVDDRKKVVAEGRTDCPPTDKLRVHDACCWSTRAHAHNLKLRDHGVRCRWWQARTRRRRASTRRACPSARQPPAQGSGPSALGHAATTQSWARSRAGSSPSSLAAMATMTSSSFGARSR